MGVLLKFEPFVKVTALTGMTMQSTEIQEMGMPDEGTSMKRVLGHTSTVPQVTRGLATPLSSRSTAVGASRNLDVTPRMYECSSVSMGTPLEQTPRPSKPGREDCWSDSLCVQEQERPPAVVGGDRQPATLALSTQCHD